MNLKRVSLRSVALFEAAKGLLVLATAGALLEFLGQGAQTAAERLVNHFHLNPASRYPRILLQLMSGLDDARLLALGLGAMAYVSVRLIEAYGLWHGRQWGWTIGFVGAGLYVPLELWELMQKITWPGIVILLSNLLILIVLWRARAE